MIQKETHAIPREDLGEAFKEYDIPGVRFIADQVLPELGVAQQAATISVTKRKNLTIPNVDHANGAAYDRVALYMDDMSFACKNRGLEGQVTDQDILLYASEFPAEVEETQNVAVKMRLAREKRVKELVFNTTTWPSGTAALFTDYSGAPWDAAGSKVIKQIQTVRELVRLNCGVPANALVISESSLINLMSNTEIMAKFPGAITITEQMMRNAMSAILGIPNLIVGQAVYNSADEGQDFSGSEIWPDDYALVGVLGTSTTPRAQPQLGRTMRWDPYANSLEYVETYREEQTESEVIRVKSFSDEKIFDEYFAHLMQIDVL
ncbi:MAG: hypothetical protein QGD93_10960 [Actinomycetota bacterium]|nr:hypothetical protein [Actinomycetota bacterium]